MTQTVGDLRKLIANLPDSTEIYIEALPENYMEKDESEMDNPLYEVTSFETGNVTDLDTGNETPALYIKFESEIPE